MTRSGSGSPVGPSQITQPLLGTSGDCIEDAGHHNSTTEYGTRSERPDLPENDNGSISAKRNKLAIGAAMYSFIILGILLSTLGAVIPYLERDYELNELQVSSVFLMGPAGYIVAAPFNDSIHIRWGRRGIAAIGTFFQAVSAFIIATKPPFPVLLPAYFLGGCGTGIIDSSWCSWAASMDHASIVSGLLHGSFATGGGLGPLLVQCLLRIKGGSWNHWYYVLAAASFINCATLTFAFRSETGVKEKSQQQVNSEVQRDTHVSYKTVLKYRAFWACAGYLLLNVGTEFVLSGWVVSFMLKARHASMELASMSSTAYWWGMALGRFVVGAFMDYVGLHRGVAISLLCLMASQVLLIITFSPQISAILMFFSGFFCGPLFPACIVQLTILLPSEMNIAAVSLITSVGQLGGALLPFLFGAFSHWFGIKVFPIIVLCQVLACCLVWVIVMTTRPAEKQRLIQQS